MPKYLVRYEEIYTYRVEIEADNEEEAERKLYNRYFYDSLLDKSEKTATQGPYFCFLTELDKNGEEI